MADPLSITASIIAVLTTCVACTKGLRNIIEGIRDAPEELMVLSNEVQNLNAIIIESRNVYRSLAVNGSSTSEFIESLQRLLKEAEDVLGALKTLLSSYTLQGRKYQSVWWLCRKTRTNKYVLRLQNITKAMHMMFTTDNT